MKKILQFLMLTALFLPFALHAQVSLPLALDFEDTTFLSQWTLDNCVDGTGLSTSQAHEGTACFAFHWTNEPSQYLISPEFVATNGTEIVSFWYANYSALYDETFNVGFSSTTNDTSAFSWGNTVTVNSSTPWTEYLIAIPAGTKYVAIRSSAYDAYYLYIDDLFIGEEPVVSCPTPTNLTAVLTPGNGAIATLNWNENGSATAWQICLNGDTTNLINTTDTSYNLTGLTPEQTYTAKVRANCNVNDHSEWSHAITFTPTDAYNITVNEGIVTNGYVPIYGLWVDNITQSQFIFPATDLTDMQYGVINKLTFYSTDDSISWGVASFNVYLTETTDTILSALADYDNMNQVYAGTLHVSNHKMEVIFNNPYIYMGGNLLIGFQQTLSGTYKTCNWYGVTATGASMGGYGIYVNQRDFLPKTTIDYTPGVAPTCMPVNNLNVSTITANGATLTWVGSADNYTIINMADSSVMATTANLTYTLSGLNPMSHYTIGVVAHCGSNQSMITTVSFNTGCAAVTLPFTESFEPASTTRNCWELVSNNSANDIGTSNGMGFMSINNHNVLRFSSYAHATDYNQYAFSPLMNIDSTADYIKADVVYATYGNGDILYLGYVTGTDTVWDPTEYYTSSNLDASTWETATLILPTNATQLAIHYFGNYQYYAWIDTVVISEMSGLYCHSVNNLTADSISTNSIALSWSDENSSGTTFTIYNMADNSVVASGITTTNYVVNGLNPTTSYSFGVVANCTPTIESSIVTVTAMTECGDVTVLPFDEGFENGLGCWTTVNGSSDGLPWSVYDCSAFMNVSPHSGNYVAMSRSWNSSAFHANTWLISPRFVLPNTTGELIFSWWEKSNNMWPDYYSVVLSTTTTDTAAFTHIVYPDTAAAGEWTMRSIDLTSYAGQSVYIAFHHVDYDKDYLIIDDINLSEIGGVPPTPDSTTVTYAVNDATMGTITPAPGTYGIHAGDSLNAAATPNANYELSAWIFNIYMDGNLHSTDTITPDEPNFANPILFGVVPQTFIDLEATFTITAVFEAPVIQYTVTLNTADAAMGSVSPDGATTVDENSSFTATAIPNNGYHFVAWMNGTTPINAANPYTFTVTEDITLTATFEADEPVVTYYTVSVTSANPEMGTASSTHSGQVAENTEVTSTATSAEGYHFVNWTDAENNVVSTDSVYTFTVTTDVTLIANFEHNVGINNFDASSILIYAANNAINVCGAEGQDLFVYDMNGRCISQRTDANETETINISASGIYLVRVGNILFKKVVIVK